jgi:hypothetical protein
MLEVSQIPSRPTWGISPLRRTTDLTQDTWLRERVENNTKELFIYLVGMMTSPTQCTM